MTESLFQKGISIIREEGPERFLQKSLRFGYRQAIDPIFANTLLLTDRDDIERLSIKKWQIDEDQKLVLTYDRECGSSLPSLISSRNDECIKSSHYVLDFESVRIVGCPTLINIGKKYFYPKYINNSDAKIPAQMYPFHIYRIPKMSSKVNISFGYLLGGSRTGFAHWFYEQLPKLYMYRAFCKKENLKPKLIISHNLTNWQKRSLELLGYPPKNHIHHIGSEAINIDRLLVPTHPKRSKGGKFNTYPIAISWIANTIVSNVPPDSNEFPDRVYVSRADAHRRQVTNESRVVSLLKKYGFEAYAPGRLSFDEQVQLFTNAEHIVGPHGAGLTNMIYADEANVIELMTENSGEHYFVLANECNHSYDCVICQEDDERSIASRHKNMSANLIDLERKIKDNID